MASQTYVQCLTSGVADGTAVTNTTTETILVPDFTLAAYTLNVGSTLRYSIYGRLSTVVTTPGTLTVRARWGGVAGTVLAASAAIALNATAQTNDTFELELVAVCRATGATGSMMATGMLNLGPGASTNIINLIPATAPAAATINTTTANALTISVAFSIASASNSIQAHNYCLESLFL